MNALLINPWINFDSVRLPVTDAAATAREPAPLQAVAAEPILESVRSPADSQPAPTTGGAASLPAPSLLSAEHVASFTGAWIETPPLPYSAIQNRNRFKPDMDAIYAAAIDGHPRDLDLDRPPFFNLGAS
jgi:hypothetical protein